MMKVYDLAHARAGDKGNTSSVAVIANNSEAYSLLKKHLTEELVAREMESLIEGPVNRYELDNICALNFEIKGALDGGVTTSLRMDAHGKSFSYVLLGIEFKQ